MGFLNIPPQTHGVILMKPLSLVTKESLNTLAQLGLARILVQRLESRLRGSKFGLMT